MSPAFTIVPLALILWIVLIVLGVLLWQKTPPPGYVPSKGVGPGQIGAVLLAVGYGAFWFMMLSPIAEKRGQGFASAIACVLYILPCIVLGLSLAGLTKDQRGLAKGNAPTPSRLASSSPSPARTPPGPRATPATPSQTPPPPSPAPTAAPIPPAGEASPTLAPTPRRPSRPQADPPAPAAEPVIQAFASETDAQVKAVSDAAAKLLPDLSRTPAHDLTRIKQRLADVEALEALAEPLAKRLQDAANDLANKLEESGVGTAESHRAAMAWANEYHAAMRSFGADAIVRLCDKAKAECENLRDNIGKWTLDAKGEFKSSDRQFSSKLKSDRFFVKSEADRRDRILDQLNGR